MKNIYFNVWNKVKGELYLFIKRNDIDLKDYNYHLFFIDKTNKHKIEVLPYPFENSISGFLMKNEDGISITFNQKNAPVRQNFTKCHELGHYILEHEGIYFAEQETDQEQQALPEIEADFYSAFILMPAIILIDQILNNKVTFAELAQQLTVSHQALHKRLMNLLTHQTYSTNSAILSAVLEYRQNDDITKIRQQFNYFKNKIIQEYKTLPDLETQLLMLLNKQDFVDSFEFEALNDEKFRDNLKNKHYNIKLWCYYNKGKNIFYAYNKNKMTEAEALKRAKLILALKY